MRDSIFPVRLIVVVIFAAFVACAAPDDSVTFVPADDPEWVWRFQGRASHFRISGRFSKHEIEVRVVSG